MRRASLSAVRRRLAGEGGFTLVELLVVCVILVVVIGALSDVFVSASHAQIDQTNRFTAEQQSRLALDALRREIHCASTLAPTTGSTYPTTSITITLGSSCPSAGAGTTVTWCTHAIVSGQRYGLWRTPSAACTFTGTSCTATSCLKKADYLIKPGSWAGEVFTAYNAANTPAGSHVRATLSIEIPVDVTPGKSGGAYDLSDDIVLRNTSRG